ncbi:MAG: hypothetical protein IJF09_10105 [Ruminiclostridium sp.]|nr:hypothetical protein [Ruminiclostridium sp.]
MSKFSEKGYVVKENAPIYLTLDMDKTAKWFEDVLGWYRAILWSEIVMKKVAMEWFLIWCQKSKLHI